jgi:hypothetical protein
MSAFAPTEVIMQPPSPSQGNSSDRRNASAAAVTLDQENVGHDLEDPAHR